MSIEELGALIIRNLNDLDAAAMLLENNVETAIADEIDRLVERWKNDHPEWDGKVDWNDKGIQLAPSAWRMSAEIYRAYFNFYCGLSDDLENDSKSYFWLTRLCQEGAGQLGFWWHCNREHVGGPNKRDWRNFIGLHKDPIRAEGFVFDESEGAFFLPLAKVDRELLATEFAGNNIDTSLRPVLAALNTLHKTRPLFDKVLASATKEFQAKGGVRPSIAR